MTDIKLPPLTLSELVRKFRACKTLAEERNVINQEGALIRDSFQDESCKYKHLGVIKLLFFQMMGYPTQFGQMECIRLLISQNFHEKRVGYLGLTQLLNETTELVMMVTNTIRGDLTSGDSNFQGLALTALANIGSTDMCRDLSKNVAQLLSQSSAFIKKKAALTAVKILRRCPDLLDDFIEIVPRSLEERNHGVVLGATHLMIEILKIEPERVSVFSNVVLNMIRMLRNLLLSGYSSEFDVLGVTDPMLQTSMIKALGILGKQFRTSEVSDVLTQVATNTDSSKNVGNAVLYDCVKAILNLKATGGSRVLATNIMGRFLLHRDNNLKYIALKTLRILATIETTPILRHKNTIVDCLKDQDEAIRYKALDLASAIINDQNAAFFVKEMLNHLISANQEFKQVLVPTICGILKQYSPDLQWHFDNLIKVLSLAGDHVPDEIIDQSSQLISAHPEIQAYAVGKLYFAMRENLQQIALVQLGTWAIGEYGLQLVQGNVVGPEDNAINISEEDVIDLLQRVYQKDLPTPTPEYLIMALAKLTVRFRNKDRLSQMLQQYTSSISIEKQQRACELFKMLEPRWDALRPLILEKVPVLQNAFPDQEPLVPIIPTKAQEVNLLDFDAVIENNSQAPVNTEAALMDIFGGGEPVDEFVQAEQAAGVNIDVFEDDIISLQFILHKDIDPAVTLIEAVFRNKTGEVLQQFKTSAQAQKHLKLQLLQTAGSQIFPSSFISQNMKVTNSQHGEKPIVLRVKVEYSLNGVKSETMITVNQIPIDYQFRYLKQSQK